MLDVSFSLMQLPPSYNHAYQRGAHGRVVLSERGRAYKVETVAELQRQYPHLLPFWKSGVSYLLIVTFIFDKEDLFTTTKRAKNRHKKVDVDNRLKLFMDALTLATGVDDSQYMGICAFKAVRSRATNFPHQTCVSVHILEDL